MARISTHRVRPLSLGDMGIVTPQPEASPFDAQVEEYLPDNDTILAEVRAALAMQFAGVILSGPPGTGKSWYAKRIAMEIAGDPAAIKIVQFHTSYQYEDFMEGFAPKDGGGFELQKKTFPLLCEDAAELPGTTHVLLIDEISRCDVARVFGEALTYMEVDKRDLEFTLASGSKLTVPRNLVILATMNPWDKGVDELDVALERRFAQIDVPPSVDALRQILTRRGVDNALIGRLSEFFEGVQKLDNELVRLGHAYFNNCVDEESSRRAWNFRLLPFFKKACRLDKSMLLEITRMWLKAFPTSPGPATQPADPTDTDLIGDAQRPG
ncbi:5-methylcytosine-specific restriction enzyme B [Devosia equisanguinis]|uniref:5-methylcytosine-specific restriction enzyme B n=1 Tax=Devosia equisanguinis TaxID=2490941 RepID=A0A3S4C9Q0_9HYPH|nr:AAA family ATPase [Devosia equisanguinis]VDS03356.1 5-methylcytosine-specific restriction enzyme B [Devosia equisanguinis]